jgi:FlaA1/EpsC-like NDP-sugar epimerase
LGSTLSYFLLKHSTTPIYYLFSIVLCTSLLTLSRILYRELRNAKQKYVPASDAKRLLIIGAGAAGSRLLDEIRTSPSCGLIPVGFIDNNPQKYGRSIGGIRVLGTLDKLESICEEENIDTIYLAIPSIANEQRSVILKKCLNTDCSVKMLPVLSEITDKKICCCNIACNGSIFQKFCGVRQGVDIKCINGCCGIKITLFCHVLHKIKRIAIFEKEQIDHIGKEFRMYH